MLDVSMTHSSDEESLFSVIWLSQVRKGNWRWGGVGGGGEGMGEILEFPNSLSGSVVSVTIIWSNT